MALAYCTLQEIRDEGITPEQASDARISMLIDLATKYIDLVTRQWFEPRELTMAFDGHGGQTIFLPVFLIAATSVTVDGQAITYYTVYNRFFPDDRRHPKIYREAGWPEGRQNIIIQGTWGFVEQAETGYRTPGLIRSVAQRLVIREIPLLGDAEGQEERKRARIISETTDGHSYTLAQIAATGDLTGDPEIDNVLAFFRAPVAVGGV